MLRSIAPLTGRRLNTLVHKFGYVFYATVRKFPCTIVISVSRSPEHREGAARNLSRGDKTKRYLPEFTLSKNEGVDMTP